MEGISLWIAGISAVALMVSVISVIAPKNSAGRAASMLGSILVLIALVSPLFDFEASQILGIGRGYEEEISKRIEETEKKTTDVKNDIIKNRLTAYVLEKAKTDESECKLSMEIQDGEIKSATVASRESAVAERVSEVLEGELGIARESVEIKTEV